MIEIAEVEITTPSVNSQDFLVFKVRVANTDWNQDVKDKIYEAARNGTPMALVMQPFQSEAPKENPIMKKRSLLDFFMKKWCDQEGLRYDEELERIYTKYKVSSRTYLTEEQLNKEIESYKA